MSISSVGFSAIETQYGIVKIIYNEMIISTYLNGMFFGKVK